jgi:hypothetical protein
MLASARSPTSWFCPRTRTWSRRSSSNAPRSTLVFVGGEQEVCGLAVTTLCPA